MAGYTVSDFGGTISLHLVYDYPNQAKQQSVIRFSEVAAYHFVHTGAAVINNISELPLVELLARVGPHLTEWWRGHGGYALWDDDPARYRAKLEGSDYRAWTIDSAIGFEGFVIAKAVAQVEPNPQGRADGRQPSRSEINRISASAASRRSP